jgi:hypothetical protein
MADKVDKSEKRNAKDKAVVQESLENLINAAKTVADLKAILLRMLS